MVQKLQTENKTLLTESATGGILLNKFTIQNSQIHRKTPRGLFFNKVAGQIADRLLLQ